MQMAARCRRGGSAAAMKWLQLLVYLAMFAPVEPACAQAGLPLHVPGSRLGLGLGIDRAQQALDEHGFNSLDPFDQSPLQRLMDLRKSNIRRLVREHREVIEADPQGDPVVRNEILASFPSADAQTRALALGFAVVRERTIAGLDIHVVVLEAPAHWSLRKSLRELRKTVPNGTYDYNHIYMRSGAASAPTTQPRVGSAPHPTQALPRVGLLDTGVDVANPDFVNSIVHSWGCGGAIHPGGHGTAVASLIVRKMPAELYAADVYCGEPTGGAVDALVAALAWMAQEQVPVINVSLVGPKNLLLAQIVAALIAKGFVIVAAVGNDGPAAPPLYPAAYPHVIGVTAVDEHRRVLLEAERGPQVKFAALGADVSAADLHRGTTTVRGTSFAAPVVAALFAAQMNAPDPSSSAAALTKLIGQAIDLGPRGRDPIYGYGLIGAP